MIGLLLAKRMKPRARASKRLARILSCIGYSLLACGALTACEVEPGGGPPLSSEELRNKVQDLYEAARSAGEDVPSDAYDWARADVERIGDWEYEIVRSSSRDDEALSELLNERGAERWEVYWIEREQNELRIFLKRPSRSYLRMLPLSELGRLVPSGGGQ